MHVVLISHGQAYTLGGMYESADRMERRNSCIKKQKCHPSSLVSRYAWAFSSFLRLFLSFGEKLEPSFLSSFKCQF